MKRLAKLAIGVITVGALLSGCSENTENNSEQTEKNTAVQEDSDKNSEEGIEESEEQEKDEELEDSSVKVYVPNQDATALVEVELEEQDSDKSQEEIIIDQLKEQETGNDEYKSAIREDIEVHSVTVEGDMAIVDLAGENLMGSGVEESFLIDSVVMSLTSLEGIERVQFLVDGEKRDSLMGHFEIAEPLTAEDVGNNIAE